MTDPFARPKELYFAFAGNRFFMDRDGYAKEYESFGISFEQEAAWRKEYIDTWTERLEVNDLTALSKLELAGAWESLPRILELASAGDDYATLWFAVAMFKLSAGRGLSDETRNRARCESNRLLTLLAAGPKNIGAAHRSAVTDGMLAAFGARTPEEYVANYARSKIAERKRHGQYDDA
jgi:hypothetical protein